MQTAVEALNNSTVQTQLQRQIGMWRQSCRDRYGDDGAVEKTSVQTELWRQQSGGGM